MTWSPYFVTKIVLNSIKGRYSYLDTSKKYKPKGWGKKAANTQRITDLYSFYAGDPTFFLVYSTRPDEPAYAIRNQRPWLP